MSNTVNTNTTANGQDAINRVTAVLEAITGKPVNIVHCGSFKEAADGSLVPADGLANLVDELECDETDSADDAELLVRPVVGPLVLKAIAALEQAKSHVESMLSDAVGGLTQDEIAAEGMDNFVWFMEHEIGMLKQHIMKLDCLTGGMAGDAPMNHDLQSEAEATF